MTTDTKMKWIDMSQAGIYLYPHDLANKKKVLLLIDCNNVLNSKALSSFDFEQVFIENRIEISKRLYMRDVGTGTISPKIFLEIGVPKELIRIVETSPEQITEIFENQFLRFTSSSINQLLNTKVLIGKNNLGDLVYASPIGRFTVNDDTDVVSIEKRDKDGNLISDHKYLRAKLRGEVYFCVQAFLNYKIELNQNISNTDLLNFTALITQKGNTSYDVKQVTSTQLELVQDALEMALVSKFASLDFNSKTHFEQAVRIFEQMPIRNLNNNIVLGLQQFTTPLPLALISQRLLINQIELEKQENQFSLLEPCLGHASLVASLTQFKNIDIIGFDKDTGKLNRISKTELNKSLDMHSGDATDINFIKFNGAKLYDFVISNFPCEQIERFELGRLQSSPNELVTTTRLDYRLLFQTLKNRKYEGRSVYLFATDAPISKGEIKPTTKFILFYLYENYVVEDFIEISGELYARQGAKYGIRLLVVGEKRAQPISDREELNNLVPQKLKFFEDYNSLWSWSNQLIDKRNTDFEEDFSNSTALNIVGDALTNQTFNEKYINRNLADSDSIMQDSLITPILSPDQRTVNGTDETSLDGILSSDQSLTKNDVDQENFASNSVSEPDPFFENDQDLLSGIDSSDQVREGALTTILNVQTDANFDDLEGSNPYSNSQDTDNERPDDEVLGELDLAPSDSAFVIPEDFDDDSLYDSGPENVRDTPSSNTIISNSETASQDSTHSVSEEDKPKISVSSFGDDEEFDLDTVQTVEVVSEDALLQDEAEPVFMEEDESEVTNANQSEDSEKQTNQKNSNEDIVEPSIEDKSNPIVSSTGVTISIIEEDDDAVTPAEAVQKVETVQEIIRVAGESSEPSTTLLKSIEENVLYEDNNYQQKYIPESKVSEPISMIPKNLATSFYRARDALVEYLELSTLPQIEDTVPDENGNELVYVGNNKFYNQEFTEFCRKTNFQSKIDAFVAYQLDYFSHEELAECFACEQVDALALAISQHKSHRGIWIGDQTGLGKGRVVAGLLRYAALQGLMPYFVTLNAQLFGDIWRDITAIKADKLFKNPFIFNDNASISEFGTTKELFRGSKFDKKLRSIDSSHDLVLASYSQFGRPGQKPEIILNSVDENSFLVFDESHKAAGEKSHINKVLVEAMSKVEFAAYSSATGIKTAANLPFYFKLFPASISREMIMTTLKDADEAVLELVSHNLSLDGSLVRREQDLSNLEFKTPEPNPEYNKYVYQLSDALSSILLDMSELSRCLMDDLNGHFVSDGDKEQFIITLFRKKHPDVKFDLDDSKLGLKVNILNFAARLYDIQRQFLLAVKTGTAIETALTALKNDQKPVISLENTGESVFNRLMAYKLNVPDENGVTLSLLEDKIAALKLKIKQAEEEEKKTDKLIAELDSYIDSRSSRIKDYLSDLESPPLFKEILLMMLETMNKAKITDKNGNSIEIIVGEGNPIYDAHKAEIRKKIEAYPDLPFMPIDIIRNEILKAGYTFGEIAGTTIRLMQNHTTKRWYAESVKSNDISERSKTVADFQSGKIDAMLITRSGSTGISLHALESKVASIPSDHLRQRNLIMLQLPLEIVEFMQTLGRVDRRGQYSHPCITMLPSCIPAENRISMMHMRKLALLSANTTSNRESRYKETDEMPDMLNEVGNKVCIDYLIENPEIASTFDIQLGDDLDKQNERDKSKYINKLLSKLIMVPIHQQELIFQDLTSKFNEYVKELEASGKNPLRVQVHNWKAKDLNVHQLKRGALDVAVRNHFGLETAFDHELTYKQVGYSQDMRPIRTSQFDDIFNEAEDAMLKQLTALLDKEPGQLKLLSTAILEYADKLDALIVEKYTASCISSVMNNDGEFILVSSKEEISDLIKNYFKKDTDPKNLRDLNIKSTKQSVRNALEVINNQKLIDSFNNAQLIIKTLRDFAKSYRSDDGSETNKHGLVLPMYCPTLDGESMIAGGVLTRIHFPPLRTNSLIPSAFKLDVLFPGEDEQISVSLSYLFAQSIAVVKSAKYLDASDETKEIRLQIMGKREAKSKEREYEETRQPVYMVYYNIHDSQEKLLKSSFDTAHEGRTNRTANIVTGNLFKAKTLLDKNVPHCSIIYTNKYGIRERGFLVSPKFTYAALEDSIYRTASTEQLSIYIQEYLNQKIDLKDFPKITFNSSSRNATVSIEYQSDQSAIMSIKGSASDVNKFLDDGSIFQLEVTKAKNSLNLKVTGDALTRGSKTFRMSVINWSDLPKLIKLMGTNGHFMNAEISHYHSEPVQTTRAILDKILNKDFAILSKKSNSGKATQLHSVVQKANVKGDSSTKSIEDLFTAD